MWLPVGRLCHFTYKWLVRERVRGSDLRDRILEFVVLASYLRL